MSADDSVPDSVHDAVLGALRADLAGQWLALARLDVVEQAEIVVRRRYEHVLLAELEAILRDLDRAERELSMLSPLADHDAITAGDDNLAAIKAQADVILGRMAVQRTGNERAEADYAARRAETLERIDSLRASIERQLER